MKVKHQSTAGLISLLVLLAVAWPVQENWKSVPKDNFPLSYFPMFSAKRSKTYKVHYVVGYDADGRRYPLSYKLCGKGGFNQVRRQIRKAAKEGQGLALLEKTAQNILAKSKYAHIERIALVEGKFHLERYFTHLEKAPISEKEFAQLKIDRP